MQPLVSVVCLCYNHKMFLKEAVESVLNQTYKNVQIIVVDDASTDGSVAEIQKLKTQHPTLELLLLPQNSGNCKAFNAGLRLAKGEFIIDFATDDVMMSDRIEKQVNFFDILDKKTGVVFTDSIYIDEKGKSIRNHYEFLFKKKLLTTVPQGDIYPDVLSTYFIASPTMMIRREVFETLQGYDETLAYEDFDFWVRSARVYRYAFLNERLTRIRKITNSLSSGWYVPGDKQLYSTYRVCEKALHLNRDEKDKAALVRRLRYELRQSVFSENAHEANLFYELLHQLNSVRLIERTLRGINSMRLPLSGFRRLYQKIRFS